MRGSDDQPQPRADEIDVSVLEYARGADHARLNGIYILQFNRALLALDYVSTTPLNRHYWPQGRSDGAYPRTS